MIARKRGFELRRGMFRVLVALDRELGNGVRNQDIRISGTNDWTDLVGNLFHTGRTKGKLKAGEGQRALELELFFTS